MRPLHPSLLRIRMLTAAVAIAVSAAVTLVTALPAEAVTTCNNSYVTTQGKYWLNNNLWGAGSGSGWQCTWDSYTSGNTAGWGTSWNWSGSPYSVKSYASLNLGWKWDTGWTNTGLPARIWDNKNINTGWNFGVSGSSTMNVAYDLWFKTAAEPGASNTDELMIWSYRSGGAGPIGTRQATVNIGGSAWDLYRGNIGWNVYSFVRQSNATSVTLNLRDFVTEIVYARGWMSNSKFLTSVEAGAEIFTGSGTLTVNSYYANVG